MGSKLHVDDLQQIHFTRRFVHKEINQNLFVLWCMLFDMCQFHFQRGDLVHKIINYLKFFLKSTILSLKVILKNGLKMTLQPL